MMTPGMPGKESPATSYWHCGPVVTQCSPTWYQTDGSEGARCGSLASRGLPVAVREPEITQEFEPTPLPAGSAGPRTDGICESSWESCESFCCAAVGSAAEALAFCSYVDPTRAPWV